MCGTGLEHLDVSGTNVSGVGRNDPIGKLFKLTYLNLHGRSLNDTGLSSLLNLCSDLLTTFNVAYTNVSGVGLNVPSGKLSNLTCLDLEGCYLLYDAGL